MTATGIWAVASPLRSKVNALPPAVKFKVFTVVPVTEIAVATRARSELVSHQAAAVGAGVANQADLDENAPAGSLNADKV
jgi:hypothetical protein